MGDELGAFHNPAGKSMPTDPTEDDKLRLILLVMAGLPKPDNNTANTGQIIQFSWKMKQENYRDDTIERYAKALTTLNKKVNINNPEQVKSALAIKQCDNGTKQITRNAVMLYYKFNNIMAELQSYKYTEKIVFIPLENELDQLISGCKHQLATFLQTLKETASRYGEIFALEWKDINTETNTIIINHPEKNSNPRAIKVSNKLMIMLSTLTKQTNKVFTYPTKDTVRKNFQRARKRIANNLCNPRIRQIHFHTFRHWRATQELRKTNNVYTVMKLLGHKNLNHTQRYINLLGLTDLSDDYICEVATAKQDIIRLAQAGYEKFTEMNGEQYFRKRK